MGVPENPVLPVTDTPHVRAPRNRWVRPAVLAVAALCAIPVLCPDLIQLGPGEGRNIDLSYVSQSQSHRNGHHGHHEHGHGHDVSPTYASSLDLELALKAAACEQGDAIHPQSFNVSAILHGKSQQIIDWLADSVKIPTEIFDVMGPVGEDPRWDVFYEFAEYLEKAFPLVHEHLRRTRVQEHALVFEWEGSDSSLKPLLLMGHQDVVPVLPATRGLWTHDPYGGEYDPETGIIWGRGSMDDKSGVIGALSAVELLLQSGQFQPERTVILSFGSDEEVGGKVGAKNLGKWIEEKYGPDSIAMIVDEGMGVAPMYGGLFATPAVAEKGYMDIEIKVETPGGHSSVPPEHTGIGLIAVLLKELERNPHPHVLGVDSPLLAVVSCAAQYAPDTPEHLKKTIKQVTDSLSKGKVNRKALSKVLEWWVDGSVKDEVLPPGLGSASVSTTQAIDVINGGVKVNALPEVVTAVVNHRINIASSVSELQERITRVLAPVAKEYGIAVTAFGDEVDLDQYHHHEKKHKHKHGKHHKDNGKHSPPGSRLIISEAYHSSLNPAPVSPFTLDAPAWRLLSGTTKGIYATRPEAQASEEEAAKDIYMAPSLMTGNTDTKHYWNLTRNIYRFAYMTMDAKLNGVHTVDEHNYADTFVEQVRWFATFIVNVDEARDI